MSKDFRYRMPDGSEIEAFQMTAATRYQEREWPPWMQSKWLMTVDNEEWLNINDVETKIPKFGWIVKLPDGRVTIWDWERMENADKVVKEQKPVHPPAQVDEEALLELGAKLTGKSVEELREEQLRQGRAARTAPPEDSPPVVEVTGQIRNNDARPVKELVGIYSCLIDGDTEGAAKRLRAVLLPVIDWCNCAPGECREDGGAGCRRHSPLAR